MLPHLSALENALVFKDALQTLYLDNDEKERNTETDQHRRYAASAND